MSEMTDLATVSTSWEYVRIYAIRFDSDPDIGRARIVLDTDVPVQRWLDGESQEFRFLVCQAWLVFSDVYGFLTNMESGAFDPAELVINEAEIAEGVECRGASGLTRWKLEGDWFDISLTAKELQATTYADPVPSDRPWILSQERVNRHLDLHHL